MTTLTEQQPKESIDWPVYLELVAAILSGALILTAWLAGKYGLETLSVPLYITAFL